MKQGLGSISRASLQESTEALFWASTEKSGKLHTASYFLGLIVWNISNCEQYSKKKRYLNRQKIFGGGWKKSTINHINLVNLNNTPQHLSLGRLAVVLTFSPAAGSAVSSSYPLLSLLSIALFPSSEELSQGTCWCLTRVSAARI